MLQSTGGNYTSLQIFVSEIPLAETTGWRPVIRIALTTNVRSDQLGWPSREGSTSQESRDPDHVIEQFSNSNHHHPARHRPTLFIFPSRRFYGQDHASLSSSPTQNHRVPTILFEGTTRKPSDSDDSAGHPWTKMLGDGSGMVGVWTRTKATARGIDENVRVRNRMQRLVRNGS